MSVLVGKLVALTLVPVVGAGVAYTTMSTKFGGDETQIKLTTIKDFEKHCWVSLQGDSNDEGGFNQKLLACDLSKNSLGIKFYFHDEKEMKGALPKEVIEVLYKQELVFSLSFNGSENKEITAINAFTWKDVFGAGIKVGCQIEHTTRNIERLGCGAATKQMLEKFVFKK